MKKYCADLQGGLWLQYSTKHRTWQAKPCCVYDRVYPIKENINLEYWQHPEIVAVRQANLNGEDLPNECKECK